MSKIYDISEDECQIIEYWIESEDCPVSFDPTTINNILNHWRRMDMKFTELQEKALLNVYNGYKLYNRILVSNNNSQSDDDVCDACMNTGRQYYCDDVYGPCLECAQPEICSHPSE